MMTFSVWLENVKNLVKKVGYTKVRDVIKGHPQYSKIISKFYNKGEISSDSSVDHLLSLLNSYEKMLAKNKIKKIDLTSFNSLPELEKYIYSTKSDLFYKHINWLSNQSLNVTVVGESEKFTIYRPNDVNSLMELGHGALWCTRHDYPNGSLAYDYFPHNTFYVIYHKNKPYLQMSGVNLNGECKDQSQGIKDDKDRNYHPRPSDAELYELMKTSGLRQYILYLQKQNPGFFKDDFLSVDKYLSSGSKRPAKDLRNKISFNHNDFCLPSNLISIVTRYINGRSRIPAIRAEKEIKSWLNKFFQMPDNEILEIIFYYPWSTDSFMSPFLPNPLMRQVYDNTRHYNNYIEEMAKILHVEIRKTKDLVKTQGQQLLGKLRQAAKLRGETITESLSPEESQMLSHHDADVIDEYTAGSYELYLIKNDYLPTPFNYQIAIRINSADTTTSFLNPEDQHNKFPVGNRINQLGAALDMIEKVKQWVTQYGEISVGSMNETKQNKWAKLLRSAGFHVTTAFCQEFNKEFYVISH